MRDMPSGRRAVRAKIDVRSAARRLGAVLLLASIGSIVQAAPLTPSTSAASSANGAASTHPADSATPARPPNGAASTHPADSATPARPTNSVTPNRPAAENSTSGPVGGTGQGAPAGEKVPAPAEDRVWISIQSDNRRAGHTIRIQVPNDGSRPLEAPLSAELQAELRRQKVDLQAIAQAVRARPAGERLEALRIRFADDDVRVWIDHRSATPAALPAASLQLQMRGDRDDDVKIDAGLPFELSSLLLTLMANLELRDYRPMKDIEALVSVSRVLEGVGRYEPFELVTVDEAGARMVLRTR